MAQEEKIGQGVAWTLASVLMYAVMNGAAKVGSGELSIWQIGLTRYLFGVVALLAAARIFGLSLWGSHYLLQLLRAGASVAAFLLMVMAFGRIPISEAMVLFYTWPAFTCLLSASVAGEPAGPKEWALVFVAFIGASVILWPQGDISHLNWGHMMALTAALLASLAMILVRRLSRDNNPIAIYFYLCLVGSLVCLAPWLKQGMGDPSELWPDSRLGLTVLAVMALPSVLSHLFVNKGFEVLRASRVGVLMTLELPVLAFFGVFFLQEPLTLRLLFGTFLILLSSMALNLERKGKQVVCDEN